MLLLFMMFHSLGLHFPVDVTEFFDFSTPTNYSPSVTEPHLWSQDYFWLLELIVWCSLLTRIVFFLFYHTDAVIWMLFNRQRYDFDKMKRKCCVFRRGRPLTFTAYHKESINWKQINHAVFREPSISVVQWNKDSRDQSAE